MKVISIQYHFSEVKSILYYVYAPYFMFKFVVNKTVFFNLFKTFSFKHKLESLLF